LTSGIVRSCGNNLTSVIDGPLADSGKWSPKGRSERREHVFNPRWHFWVHRAEHQAILFKVSQCLRQHLLTDAFQPVTECGIAMRLPVSQLAQQQDSPLVTDAVE
jgi:hypothetical protein